jgi:nitrate/TMAO reductase-like tetraheme cytochrome c subunit
MRHAIQAAAVATLVWGLCAHPIRAEPPTQEHFGEVAKACLDCHETPEVMGIMMTAHCKAENAKTPAANRQCQSCHGPSVKHMMFPMQVENVSFGKNSASPPEKQNAFCLECHNNGKSMQQEDWKVSAHGYEKVVCSTCHSMHDPDKMIPARADVEATCSSAGCHNKLMKASQGVQYTHALRKNLSGKGELTCSGCHNPHGPLESSRCLDCHPQTPEVLAKESQKARRFHAVAKAKGTECTRCHKGIAHEISPLVLEKGRLEMERLIQN